jgi:hypothetical protein
VKVTLRFIVQDPGPTYHKMFRLKDIRRTVLAFDVGVKNMAYCVLREHSVTNSALQNGFQYNNRQFEILKLEKFSIGEWGTNTPKLVHTLCNRLSDIYFDTPDVVVIEKQVAQCSTLRILQFCLQSYFMGRWDAMSVKFQDGDSKLKLCDQDKLAEEKLTKKNKYRVNKKFALLRANEVLKHTQVGSQLINEKKGDDLADAFLHALYYSVYK